MAENTQVVSGSGDTVRTHDRGTAKTEIVLVDVGGTLNENITDTPALERGGNLTLITNLLQAILLEQKIMNHYLHHLNLNDDPDMLRASFGNDILSSSDGIFNPSN